MYVCVCIGVNKTYYVDSIFNEYLHIRYILSVYSPFPIAQLVSALDLVTSSVQVEGSILTAGKRLSLKI